MSRELNGTNLWIVFRDEFRLLQLIHDSLLDWILFLAKATKSITKATHKFDCEYCKIRRIFVCETCKFCVYFCYVLKSLTTSRQFWLMWCGFSARNTNIYKICPILQPNLTILLILQYSLSSCGNRNRLSRLSLKGEWSIATVIHCDVLQLYGGKLTTKAFKR